VKKQDIDISYHSGTRGLPMVNVKVGACSLHPSPQETEFPDTRFPEWLDVVQAESPATIDAAWEAACTLGFEQAEALAHDMFGRNVKVWSAGRSGGWLVVEGLPPVETWDALATSKWASFARRVRAIADDIPYLMRDYLYFNPFAAWLEQAAPVVPPAVTTL